MLSTHSFADLVHFMMHQSAVSDVKYAWINPAHVGDIWRYEIFIGFSRKAPTHLRSAVRFTDRIKHLLAKNVWSFLCSSSVLVARIKHLLGRRSVILSAFFEDLSGFKNHELWKIQFTYSPAFPIFEWWIPALSPSLSAAKTRRAHRGNLKELPQIQALKG